MTLHTKVMLRVPHVCMKKWWTNFSDTVLPRKTMASAISANAHKQGCAEDVREEEVQVHKKRFLQITN